MYAETLGGTTSNILEPNDTPVRKHISYGIPIPNPDDGRARHTPAPERRNNYIDGGWDSTLCTGVVKRATRSELAHGGSTRQLLLRLPSCWKRSSFDKQLSTSASSVPHF